MFTDPSKLPSSVHCGQFSTPTGIPVASPSCDLDLSQPNLPLMPDGSDVGPPARRQMSLAELESDAVFREGSRSRPFRDAECIGG